MKHTGFSFFGLGLVLIVLSSCSLGPKQVKYEVLCTAIPNLVSITIENEGGGTSQYTDVATPWNYQFEGSSGDFVYVSAQNQQDHGNVTATIYINGGVFQTSTSSGAYVIASAYGSIP